MTATPDNPYAQNPYASASTSAPNRYGANSLPAYAPPVDATNESHAFREQSFFQQASTQMDEFLERGADVLGNLGQQKDMLKNTQRKLYSVGNTLGISGDTIRMVERRARQDKWIFWGGVVVFFLFCYLVLRWLR
jgi:Golgi SNAP receptor complex protein 2